MDREEALSLVRELIQNENLVRHHLAVEAVMRRLAADHDGDPETWGLVGLLPDADYELTGHDPETHGRVMAEKLEARGVDPVIIEGVMAHNAAVEAAWISSQSSDFPALEKAPASKSLLQKTPNRR